MKTLLLLVLALGSVSAHASSNIVRCRGIDVTFLPFYNVELQVLATQSMGDAIHMKVSIDEKVQLGGFGGRITTIHQDLNATLSGPTARMIALFGENESGKHRVGSIRLEQNLVSLRHAFLKLKEDREEVELVCQ